MCVLLSLLLTLRTSARLRAPLQLEVLALRHQLEVLQRARPSRVGLGRNGLLALGIALAHLDRLANGAPSSSLTCSCRSEINSLAVAATPDYS